MNAQTTNVTQRTRRIWDFSPSHPHELVQFRKRFQLSKAGVATLRIAVETDFILYCDEQEILRRQYQDYPASRRYREVHFPLVEGSHLLAVLAYFQGEDFQTSVGSDLPGLWLEMRLPDGCEICSDESFRARPDPTLLHDRLDKVTPQIGFVFGIDGRKKENWLALEYDDADWKMAIPLGEEWNPRPAPVPSMSISPRQEIAPMRRENIFRMHSDANDQSYAAIVAQDEYGVPKGKANGIAILYDLGCERFGLVEVELTADRGTVLDVSYGEHLADGHIRNRIGSRNFTERYLAGGKPREQFGLFRAIGGRYIQLNVVGAIEELRLFFRATSTPLSESPTPPENAEDAKMWEASKRTLTLCMSDHYMDCPWREQALYGGDSRLQMLFGYGLWGNYDYARASLGLLCRSVLPNGLIAISSPSVMPPQIPVFGMHLANIAAEWTLYSGKPGIWEECRSSLRTITSALTEKYDATLELYLTPARKGAWNFYEWSRGLDGFSDREDCTLFDHLDGTPLLESPYNLHLLEFFRNLYQLSGDVSFAERAESLVKAIRTHYWDAENAVLRTRDDSSLTHEAVQAIALYLGVIPEHDRIRVWEQLKNGRHVPITLSSFLYLLEAAYQDAQHGNLDPMEWVAARMRTIFEPMPNACGTYWETAKGEADFDGAGSLCHGWSAIPIWFFQRVLLGVREDFGYPDGVVIAPCCIRERASGRVKTRFGEIAVQWSLSEGALSVCVPASCKVRIAEGARLRFRRVAVQGTI